MPKAKQKRKGSFPPEPQLLKRPKIVHDPGPSIQPCPSPEEQPTSPIEQFYTPSTTPEQNYFPATPYILEEASSASLLDIPEEAPSASLLDIPEEAPSASLLDIPEEASSASLLDILEEASSASLLDIPEEAPSASLLDIPEELICQILDELDLYSVSCVEVSCKHLFNLIKHARLWRKILFRKIDTEPLIQEFISREPDWEQEREFNPENITDELLEQSNNNCKALLRNLKEKLDFVWNEVKSDQPPTMERNSDIYNVNESMHFLYHIQSTGKYFLAFWGPMKTDSRSNKDYIVNIFDRVTGQLVKRLTDLHGKPDLVRVIDDLGLVMLSYPSYLMIELVQLRLGEVEKLLPSEYLDLGVPGDGVTGSVCDIVVRENVMMRGQVFRRVVLVAMNTEPMENRVIHIGQIQLFHLRQENGVTFCRRLWSMEFRPVPTETGEAGEVGRFFNQCIQKKGLCDFNSSYAVVVIGGRDGSAVLAVLSIPKVKISHRLQLRGDSDNLEGGCEGGACQYSVVSLMIDRVHQDMCAILLSTGQLNVIQLDTGTTIFNIHLEFDGQLKLALHQPKFSGTQRIAVKFRNFVSFYDLTLSRVSSKIQLKRVRTLRITSVDGREAKLDDNPSQELRKQFGELQRRVRALNNYTSGIQKKLDKGLRPGTVTQGVLSMTRKVQLVTSKLDQAHGKAREIEAIVIASIAFDNRFCHALTLNRDLVVFDMLGVDSNSPYVYMDVDTVDETDESAENPEFPVAGPSSRNTRSSRTCF